MITEPLVYILTLLICISHVSFAMPFFTTLRRKALPDSIHFVGMSYLLYFDVGLLLEALGYRYSVQYFTPFFQGSYIEILYASLLIAVAPWIMWFGYIIVWPKRVPLLSHQLTQLRPDRRLSFYAINVAACLVSIAVGLWLLSLAEHVWQTRFLIGERLGPSHILLYFPMCLLAFYVHQRDIQSFSGKLFSIFVLVSSILATVAFGERTLVLMPFLLLALFRTRLSLSKLVVIGLICSIAASLLLPLFKSYFDDNDDLLTKLSHTVYGDFYRAPMLRRSIGDSPAIGTRVMPYWGAGYVYNFLFFVPRVIVPFKGEATAKVWTAALEQQSVESTTWAIAFSPIDELIVNFGYAAAVPGLFVYGLALGGLERLVRRVPSTVVPSRVGCIWLMGYQLPAILMIEGIMLIVGVVFESVFAESVPAVLMAKTQSN